MELIGEAKLAEEGRGRLALFAGTLFLSAFALFWVQPLAAKVLLPRFGGAPAVWNTCMMFYQLALLAGYLYAHWISTLDLSRQRIIHLVLILLVFGFLLSGKFAPGMSGGEGNGNPISELLLLLTQWIALPFFFISTTAPLLQKWFARTGNAFAADPYFLYAASNAGSFAALISFPALIEPALRVGSQLKIWTTLVLVLGAAIALCSVLTQSGGVQAESKTEPSAAKVGGSLRLRWIGLAFVPSTLMLGLTTYITTDVAPVPLLWVIPLALYLLSFVLVFARKAVVSRALVIGAFPILCAAVVLLMLIEATEPGWLLIAIHMLFLFAAAMLCHGTLADSRPQASHLTEFYLCMSIGGALGGIFNSLIAPMIFKGVIEYPIAIALACICLRNTKTRDQRFLVTILMCSALVFAAYFASAKVPESSVIRTVAFGLLAICGYFTSGEGLRFGLVMGGMLLAASVAGHGHVLYRDRNFFGVVRVVQPPGQGLHRLYHGTTIHGMEWIDQARRCEPLSYYHRDGPAGQIMELFREHNIAGEVGAIGLGAGAMISYAKPGEKWTFFEIDPAVIRVAENTNFFRYLHGCNQADWRIVEGDARLQLTASRPRRFALLIADAFSSDAIPLHLLSLEAIQLYKRSLAPDGWLAMHISSRHFELAPLIANLADACGLVCFRSVRSELPQSALGQGGHSSDWVLLVGKRTAVAGELGRARDWIEVKPSAKGPFWTDDFSNILSVFRW